MRAIGAASTPGLHCEKLGKCRAILGTEIYWGRGSTWPPEKPTATTPSSWPFERNFWGMVDGDVIMERFVGERWSNQ